jgi:hypothetical protein
MVERRQTARRTALKEGTIAFNRGGGISCIIRNISSEGACLEVVNPIGIPDAFVLVIQSEGMKRPCEVMWRRGRRLGVAFT